VIAFARQPRLIVERANRESAAKLLEQLAALPSEGGTNLEAALALATEKAQANRTPDAQNRIVLLTDGAANLGDANADRLAERIHALRQDGIAFDAAGIGADGLNDTILEALTRKGDGRYYLLDRPEDADEGFARKLAGAFRPGAKDVKVQIQFNPDRVGRYRLLGFEEHRLNKEDFRDDTVDAAELASEEAGVATYQVEVRPEGSGDIGFVSVRFLDVASGERVERRWLIPYEPGVSAFDQASPSLRLAGLASWTAAKLKDDGAAAGTDWAALNRIHAALPETWKSLGRIRDLGQMLRTAEDLGESR
jgi:Ca-activated chloride channel homolog